MRAFNLELQSIIHFLFDKKTGAPVLISICSSTLISGVVTHYLGKRRDKEIEKLKTSLAEGSYIGRAQFDLEVEAYKELWQALSELRLEVRSFQMDDALRIRVAGQEDRNWHNEAFPGVLTRFAQAHNRALKICEKFAPFYPASIHQATLAISQKDGGLLNFLGDQSLPQFSDKWYQALRHHVDQVWEATVQVEMAVRGRLEILRVVR